MAEELEDIIQSEEELELSKSLAEYLEKWLKYDFTYIHLSRNLMDTITVTKRDDGKGYTVSIPAQIYDMKLYKQKGVVVYKGTGSYASKVNTTGGHSKLHKHYVEKAIQRAIEELIKTYDLNVNLKGIKL